jgi:hypothetical protein
MSDDAARNAHESGERTQYSYPMQCIHSLVLLEVIARRIATQHSGPRP